MFGFPRSARLLAAADFKRVFAQPKRSADAYFTVLARSRDDRQTRLGLAISKKQIRHAVQRNRLKRLVREVFRQHRHQLTGFDIVVMARSAASNADNDRLIGSLTKHVEGFARNGQVTRP